MLVTRWNPLEGSWLRQMHNLHEEMNRLFSRWNDWSGQSFDVATFPALNVWEEDDAFRVEAELPGLTMNDLEIYVTGQNQLAIKGERKVAPPQKAVQHRQERHFGKFVRALTLPSAIDPNKVDARLDNGVLTIVLPKHEGAKPRKIEVKA
ncbi:MAG: Hsp20/alpha crystallin family protein [Gemmataceae bacterium]|nr:Hsp20/alpha crystallin family protein [Gemmataceae bacterium]